jgi:hypothetical protein
MIEDRLLGGCARIGRVKEGRDRLRDGTLCVCGGAAHTEEESTKEDGFENVLE